MPEEQTRAKELPQADLALKNRQMQEMLRFALGNPAAKLTLDENDNINLKTNYAPTMARNLEAQTQATQQAGLPSYGGIDPEMVMQLMKQRGQQDAQMAGQTGRDMQGMYQGALAQQAMQQPQLKVAEMIQRMASGQQDRQTQLQVAGLKAQGSPMDRFKLGLLNRLSPGQAAVAAFPSLKPEQAAAKVQIYDKLIELGKTPDEAATISFTPGMTPEAQALAIVKAEASAGVGFTKPEKLGTQMQGVKEQFTPATNTPTRQPMPKPNPNIAKAPPMKELRATGEAAKIKTTGKMPAKYWQIDADVPGLGKVTNVFGSWAEIDLGNGETLVVTKGK